MTLLLDMYMSGLDFLMACLGGSPKPASSNLNIPLNAGCFFTKLQLKKSSLYVNIFNLKI